MKIVKVLPAALMAIIVSFSTFAGTPVADAAENPVVIDGATIDVDSVDIKTEADLEEFILSSTPKTITVNTDSGEVTAVTDAPRVEPMAIGRNTCYAGDVCWYALYTPYANWGVTLTGSAYGNYQWRDDFYSGRWTARGIYQLPRDTTRERTAGWVGPYTTINFGGGDNVIGIRVDVS